MSRRNNKASSSATAAEPRNERPDLGDPRETMQAMMGMLLGGLTGEEGGGGSSSFLPGCSEGCMETEWRGLPARELFLAAHQGRVKDLQELLRQPEHRARIHDFDNDKVPILCCYALSGNTDGDNARGVVDALVEAGYDVNLRSKSTKETPLQYATLYGRVKVVDALLKHGARVDLTDWRGQSPVITAREKCHHQNTNGGTTSSSEEDEDHDENCCQVLRLIEKAQQDQQENSDLKSMAEALRQRGNVQFQKGQFVKARDLYTQSLDVLEDHRTFANRAQCAINLGKELLRKEAPKNLYSRTIADWGQEAMLDASKAVTLEPTFAKAHYRITLGQAMARDFPRAKASALDGLKACGSTDERVAEALTELLGVLNQWGVPDHISNPYSPFARDANERVKAGEETHTCPFCRARIPLSLLEETCPFCTMKIESAVRQADIVAFILDH